MNKRHKLNLQMIPSILKQISQWVVWIYIFRGGKSINKKPTKVPYSPNSPTLHASVADPQTWGSFRTSLDSLDRYHSGSDGIGFVFTADDQFCGIDLDHCRNPETGVIDEWAQKIISALNSYTEISPSGTGVHILIIAKLPVGGRRKGKIEMYDQDRYFCMTGNHLKDTPTEIHERQFEVELLHSKVFGIDKQEHIPSTPPVRSIKPPELLEDETLLLKAKQAKNGELFTALWEGKWEEKYESQSEADLALCNFLAFWTGKNLEQMDRLFRESELYRDKWDEKHYGDGRTYGQGTIEKAINECAETYHSPNINLQFNPITLPFPLDAFPPPLKNFIQELSKALPVPVDLAGICVLVTAASAIGATRVIEVKPGWEEPAILFAAIVGDPGTLKSPTLKTVLEPVTKYQKELRIKYQNQLLVHELAMMEYEEKMAAVKKGTSKDQPLKPKEPKMPRVCVIDITTEKLGGLLSENPRGLLLARDELSAWVTGQNQYKGGKGTDRSFYLGIWNSAQIHIDRQTSPTIIVDNPVMSIMGCIPPEVLPDLQDKDSREDGFIHRILFAFPTPVIPTWSEIIVTDEAKKQYEELIRTLYELEPAIGSDFSESVNRTLKFTTSAKEIWIAWHDAHVRESSNPSLPKELRGFYAKLKGYCARFCLILAVCSNPKTQHIDKISVEAACDLTEYFKGQACAILPFLKQGKLSQQESCERAILRALEGKKEESRRDLQRKWRGPAKIFNETVDEMVKAEVILKIENDSHKQPKHLYKLNNETINGDSL